MPCFSKRRKKDRLIESLKGSNKINEDTIVNLQEELKSVNKKARIKHFEYQILLDKYNKVSQKDGRSQHTSGQDKSTETEKGEQEEDKQMIASLQEQLKNANDEAAIKAAEYERLMEMYTEEQLSKRELKEETDLLRDDLDKISQKSSQQQSVIDNLLPEMDYLRTENASLLQQLNETTEMNTSKVCDDQKKSTDEEEDINPIVPSQRDLVEELEKAKEEIRQRTISENYFKDTIIDQVKELSYLYEELERKEQLINSLTPPKRSSQNTDLTDKEELKMAHDEIKRRLINEYNLNKIISDQKNSINKLQEELNLKTQLVESLQAEHSHLLQEAKQTRDLNASLTTELEDFRTRTDCLLQELDHKTRLANRRTMDLASYGT
ncbi:hypothetical protein WMY93_020532 [Mugilogobius chulae]|uniref:Uncharacterized protein n=1 Tax=Mugilogobius chulae TaxID=88201 RepID=A0AAW0N847_9GOBI